MHHNSYAAELLKEPFPEKTENLPKPKQVHNDFKP